MWLTLLFLTLPIPPPQGDLPANRPECRDRGAETYFFPQWWLGERLSNGYDQDRFRRQWFSSHLGAMAEPSLSCRAPAGDVYRFLWLRTFTHPIAVRVERSKHGAVISAVELTGGGGFLPGQVFRRVERKLSDAEWSQLSDGIRTLGFWTMPARSGRGGTDGAEWILEGRKGSHYRAVLRWSPRDAAFREVCLSFLKLVDWVPTEEGKGGIY